MFFQRWFTPLEEQAAAWVDKCMFAHQADPEWGENIYRSEFNRAQKDIISIGNNSIYSNSNSNANSISIQFGRLYWVAISLSSIALGINRVFPG
jgi:hypothetical protein